MSERATEPRRVEDLGTVRISPDGEHIAVQCGWATGGQNVRTIHIETGIGGYATSETVAAWEKLHRVPAGYRIQRDYDEYLYRLGYPQD